MFFPGLMGFLHRPTRLKLATTTGSFGSANGSWVFLSILSIIPKQILLELGFYSPGTAVLVLVELTSKIGTVGNMVDLDCITEFSISQSRNDSSPPHGEEGIYRQVPGLNTFQEENGLNAKNSKSRRKARKM
jgi:hypothetical protein